MMIVGVDASLGSTGLAAIDHEKQCVIDLRKIRTTTKKATPTESSRIQVIFEEISAYFDEFSPDIVVIENQFIGRGPRGNKKTGMLLSRVRGVIQLAAQLKGIPIYTLEANEVKKVTTGKGNASKEDVQSAIAKIYQHEKIVQTILAKIITSGKDKTDDIADALAIAHTYSVEQDIAVLT